MADLVGSILRGKQSSYEINDTELPTVKQWFDEMDLYYEGFIVFSTVCTALVIVISFLHLYYVLRYISNEHIQTDLYYLVFMFPV
ncbi:unnamed protein product, partial [Mesorhabditis spiculigera]